MNHFQFKTILFLFLSILLSNYPAWAQNSSTPVEIARTPTYSEAPVIDRNGNIYVSEPYRGPITKITPNGDTSTWAKTKGANGHRILEDGTHLVCDRIEKAVLKLDAEGKIMGKAASTCGDKPLRHPNDLILDKSGGFYFTDPMDRNNGELMGRVCYVDQSGKSHLVTEYEEYTNGITLSSDGKTLFLASSFNNEIRTFPIKAPGEVGPSEVFAKLPVRADGKFSGPDGILLSEDGKLYVAQYNSGKVFEFNAKGHLQRSINAGQERCSNIALTGQDENTLLITGAPGALQDGGILYQLNLKEYQENLSNPLLGAWELIEGTYNLPDNPTERKQPDNPFQLKVFSPGHFSYVIQKPDGSFAGASAGSYRLEGNQYTETHLWNSNGNNGIATFEYKIEGDLLYMDFLKAIDPDGNEVKDMKGFREVRRRVK